MSAKQTLADFQERRKQERRSPLLILTIAEAEALLAETRFTGSVTVMWASGVKKEMQFPDPMRIVLDKQRAKPDSRDGND